MPSGKKYGTATDVKKTRWLKLFVFLLFSCKQDLQVKEPAYWRKHVTPTRRGQGAGISGLRYREEVCRGENMSPTHSPLQLDDLVEFLRQRGNNVVVERRRDDLAYLVVASSFTEEPARLRVAILKSRDEAGHELAQALAQSPPGAWGIHRENLAVLGPVGETSHDLAYAAQTHLVCWGVFTLRTTRETLVVPGGYQEL